MILNNEQIIASNKNGTVKIEDFSLKQVRSASYYLRVGPQALTSTGKSIIQMKKKGYAVLEPGETGMFMSLEILNFDNEHVGRFGLNSKYSRKGVFATVGAQIDAGFSGRLFIGLLNMSPEKISIPFDDDFLKMEIHKLSEPTSKPYSGSFQNKTDFSNDDIDNMMNKSTFSFTKIEREISALAQNVGKLAEKVNKMATFQQVILWIIPISFALIALFIAIKG